MRGRGGGGAEDGGERVECRGREGTGRRVGISFAQHYFANNARFDFDTDSPNVKVKLLCPGLVKDILWSPCKQPELFQGLKCKPGLLRC